MANRNKIHLEKKTNLRVVEVLLDDMTVELATRLGRGNLSRGLRRAMALGADRSGERRESLLSR